MDQTKIGKLIAKLRKEKGMTQRELGDQVGVGFKAVSKWERGITCPDISIINELSKILGITSDELLTGELSKEHQLNNKNNTKINKKLLLIIPILLIIIITFPIIFKNKNNQVNVYKLAAVNEEYYIEGKMLTDKNKAIIYIDKIKFIDKNFNNTIIKNYEYEINSGGDTIISYGYIPVMQMLPSEMTISEFSNSFKTEQIIPNEININKIIKNGITLKLTFLDKEENLFDKSIAMTLSKQEK